MFEVRNDARKRTIYIRLTGSPTVDELRAMDADCRAATDSYRGQPHLVLADLRGLGVLAPEGAAIVGQTIDYGRKRSVRCCAHLSDSSIVRLQTRRLAREVSANDDVTVDVVSLDEAERVLAEWRSRLPPSGESRHP
jgi:hypothetical protein